MADLAAGVAFQAQLGTASVLLSHLSCQVGLPGVCRPLGLGVARSVMRFVAAQLQLRS